MKASDLRNSLFVILLLGFVLSSSNSKGTSPSSGFGVQAGDQATYYVIEYFVNATELPPEYGGTGELFVINQFTVAGSSNITAGTSEARFNIRVGEVSQTEASYEVRHGNNAQNVSESGSSFALVTFFHSLLFAEGFNESTAAIALSDSYDLAGTPVYPGSALIFPNLPFILPLTVTDPDTQLSYDTWTALSTHFYTQTYVDTYQAMVGGNLTLIFSSETVGDDIELSAQVNGTLQATGDQLTINHTLNFIVEKPTGMLKYLKDFLDVEGTIAGNVTVAKKKIEIERESFTAASSTPGSSEPSSSAPSSEIGSESSSGGDSVPGFGFPILLVCLSVLGAIVLSKKRKW